MNVGLLIVEQTLNGIQFGVFLFLIAAGLTLVFGIMNLVNLAHGALYMVGAYFGAAFFAWSGSFLVAIVLFGEVMPKMLANAQPVGFTQATAPLLRTLHASIVPLRVAVDRLVVTPLSRLTAPAAAPPRLDEEELRALLES